LKRLSSLSKSATLKLFSPFFFTVLWACILSLAPQGAYSQKTSQVGNLQSYENEWLHFGFALGVNSSNFIIHSNPDFYKYDSLKSITSKPEPGFNLGIIAELKISEYFYLRFVPDLAFAQRDLDYFFIGKAFDANRVKKVESTFLNFPLDLKLKSKRVAGNYGGYLLAGMKYTYDLASNEDVDNTNLDINKQVIKLKKSDWAYEVGAGIEVYLPYFKFAMELKTSFGLKNILINDNTIFSNPIEKLNSKIILVSFTFEG